MCCKLVARDVVVVSTGWRKKSALVLRASSSKRNRKRFVLTSDTLVSEMNYLCL